MKEGPVMILNSLYKKLITYIHKIIGREGINQNCIGNKIKTNKILNQLREEVIDVDGSKIEKIFIIMFNFSF